MSTPCHNADHWLEGVHVIVQHALGVLIFCLPLVEGILIVVSLVREMTSLLLHAP